MNGRVPRYHRIAEALREQIRAGELPPGAPLPNQRKLAKTFGVTLMTLRQALELLERDSLIVRRHGLGTFVPAFASERISFDTEGRPAVFDRVFIPGDRFRITRELHYDASTSTTGAPE